jgi:hypothetical protein
MGSMSMCLAFDVEIENGSYADGIGHKQKCAIGREITHDAINY